MITVKISNKNENIQVGSVHYFTDEFLNSISILMSQAKKIKHDSHDYIYIIPSIILSMAFLESAFQLFMYNLKVYDKYYNIENKKRNKMIENYNINSQKLRSRYLIENKFNDVLSIVDIKEIGNTNNIEIIRKIRNYIIHDEVELIAPWAKETEDVIIKLLKNKFLPKCKNKNLDSYYWFDYLNYHGATWIIKEIFDFYNSFCSNLNIENIFFYKIEKIKQKHPCTVKVC